MFCKKSNLPVSDKNQNTIAINASVTIRSINFLEMLLVIMQNTINPPVLSPDTQVMNFVISPTTSMVIIIYLLNDILPQNVICAFFFILLIVIFMILLITVSNKKKKKK